MPGPPPSSNIRRGQHHTPLQWTSLPTDAETIAARVGPVPDLPPGHWHEATKAKWKAWWRLPVAVEWSEADRGAVERMAFLWDEVYRGEATAATHTRLDTIEANLGLTPKARVQLRWRIEGEELPAQDRNGGVASAKVSNLADHRAWARKAAKGG